jgi:eukaryotic-like serine/threonine-protein kinase
MGSIARSGTWDEASSPAATRLARRFEDAWRDPRRKRNDRPDPEGFLAEEAEGTLAPSAWLAVLRADLNLRWDDGESVRVEAYRDRFPGLDAETMVALCYEEFCRREEDGQAPFPAEYDERFPELSERLRRVFDIHELVGNAVSTDLHVPGPELTPFPEARQTIAGFHLVEELGRGSFARVFLAQERQLADRPVALKVARTGSREPQTLARLQHTHIVPVHSYRTDPVTGLHLLCMPYFGRITLARLLADPAAKAARNGADLLEALDRLGSLEQSSSGDMDVAGGLMAPPPRPSPARGEGASGSLAAMHSPRPTPSPLAGEGRGGGGSLVRRSIDQQASGGSRTRANFARLPFAQAIAWWGSRLAEALAHAHDRGVLHRDVKPSNVLVTGDGLPMLLDFNLAGEPWADRQEFEPDHLGGTLAYMAPEHLDAVSGGDDDLLDARADVFSLGVMLFEALTGSRPFPSPKGNSVAEALQRAAEDRRRVPPWICRDHPEIPAPLERVIRRCLEPDPSARFPNASELAADLQAVADDAPLKWTREPLLVRGLRRARRSWKKALLVALLAGSAVALGMLAWQGEEDRAKVASTASDLLKDGRRSLSRDDFATATARFEEVARLTSNQAELADLNLQARRYKALARNNEAARAKIDAFLKAASTIRFHLIGVDGRFEDAEGEVERLMAPFRISIDLDWARSAELSFLDSARKSRLIREVEEVLFLLASGQNPRDVPSSRRGVELCDQALAFTDDPKPWRALRNWLNDAPVTAIDADPHAERSARSCFEWGVLLDMEGRKDLAITWLKRAATLERGNSWYHYHLATLLARGGDMIGSIAQFEAALALEPSNRRFRLDKAEAHRSLGEWVEADELEEGGR